MLARKNRLHRTKEIKDVLKHGDRVQTPEVYVYYQPSSTPYTRIATIVGKKVHTHATKRHRYQRWLRSLAQDYLNSDVTKNSYDMVWVAQPALQRVLELKSLEESLRPKLKQLT